MKGEKTPLPETREFFDLYICWRINLIILPDTGLLLEWLKTNLHNNTLKKKIYLFYFLLSTMTLEAILKFFLEVLFGDFTRYCADTLTQNSYKPS